MTSVPPGIDDARPMMCHTSPPWARRLLATRLRGHTPRRGARRTPPTKGRPAPRAAPAARRSPSGTAPGKRRLSGHSCAYVCITSTCQRSGVNGMWGGSEVGDTTPIQVQDHAGGNHPFGLRVLCECQTLPGCRTPAAEGPRCRSLCRPILPDLVHLSHARALTTATRNVHDEGMTLSYVRRQKERMPTTRKAITISMPPKMAEQVRQVMEDEGRTMSELIREALRQYMDARERQQRGRHQRAEARTDDQE